MRPSTTFRTAVALPLMFAAQAAGMAPSAIAGETPGNSKAAVATVEGDTPQPATTEAKRKDGVLVAANTVASKSIETADTFKITTPAEARQFAEKYLVKLSSDIDKGFEARMQTLVDVVPFKEGSKAYAPELFMQRLLKLHQGGVFSEDDVKLYLNYKDAPDAYGSVTDLRQRVRAYEANRESMSKEGRTAALKVIQERVDADIKDFLLKSNRSRTVVNKEN